MSRLGSAAGSARVLSAAWKGLVAGVALSFVSHPASAALTGENVAKEAGIYEVVRTWSANVADFNGDGWKDVLIVRHNDAPAVLYRNDGGTFTEVNEGLFSTRDRHDCAWGDVNNDGRPDVYCTLGACQGTCAHDNELWIQQPDGTFVDQAAAFGVTDPYGRGRWTTFIDVNHDPYPDLFVGNWYPREDNRESPNRLFINMNGTSFRDAPEYGLNKEKGADSAQSVDYDQDGWEDLLVCGKEKLILYRNKSGQDFDNVTSSVDLSGECKDALIAKMDGGKSKDLVRIKSGRVKVVLQKDGQFDPVYEKELDSGRALAQGDIDEDGDKDLYVLQSGDDSGTGNDKDFALRNDGTGKSFSSVDMPRAQNGRGDDVEAIDYDDNGMRDFVVLNGRGDDEGPIQLIRFHY
jgi:hypothetical protein